MKKIRKMKYKPNSSEIIGFLFLDDGIFEKHLLMNGTSFFKDLLYVNAATKNVFQKIPRHKASF